MQLWCSSFIQNILIWVRSAFGSALWSAPVHVVSPDSLAFQHHRSTSRRSLACEDVEADLPCVYLQSGPAMIKILCGQPVIEMKSLPFLFQVSNNFFFSNSPSRILKFHAFSLRVSLRIFCLLLFDLLGCNLIPLSKQVYHRAKGTGDQEPRHSSNQNSRKEVGIRSARCVAKQHHGP